MNPSPAAHSPLRYTGTAIALHWLVALLLLGQFAFGLALEDIPRGTPERGYFVNLHKSTGVLIGVLIVLRLGWRLTHRAPPLPVRTPGWQRRASSPRPAGMSSCSRHPMASGDGCAPTWSTGFGSTAASRCC